MFTCEQRLQRVPCFYIVTKSKEATGAMCLSTAVVNGKKKVSVEEKLWKTTAGHQTRHRT